MPHLLDAASVIITPTAYDQDSLLALKPIDGSGDIEYVRNSVATRINEQGLLELLPINMPRIDYASGTGVILSERETINRVQNSDPTSVSGTGITTEPYSWSIGLLQNAIVFPSGSSTSTNREGTMPTGVNTTVSCFVIMDDLSEPRVGFHKDFTLRVNNITVDDSSVKVLNLGNNVYRVSGVVESSRNTSTQSNSGVLRNSNNTGKGFRVSGVQIEEGSVMTSYIPTSGGISTRVADTLRLGGSLDSINDNEGVLYAELRFTERTSRNFSKPISISDGSSPTTNSVFLMRIKDQEDKFRVSFRDASNVGLNIDFFVPNSDEFFKIAIQYKSGESKIFVNGAQVSTTKTTTYNLSGLDRINLSNGVGSEKLEGEMKSAVIFTETLTDEELICLTQ